MRDQGAVFGAGELVFPTTRCRRLDHRQHLTAHGLQTFGDVQVVEVGPLDLALAGEHRGDHLTADDQRGVGSLLFAWVPGVTVGRLVFQSSSRQMINGQPGKRSRMALETGSRLPASKAMATVSEVAMCRLAPVA